jgi:[acyl-carrier-protein] S-malonyltransferase
VNAVWLFPGQGSHHLGMAGAWAAGHEAAREALAEAAEVLGFDLPRLIAEGPSDELDDTFNQQPAILAASIAVLRAARERLPAPAYVAGHSLGEITALVAAGALAYHSALVLVRERGRLMRAAGRARPGRMAAVLGLDDEAVAAVCDEVDGVEVANYNAPGQVVISGEPGAVDAASERLRTAGAKRVVPLAITIAAHSRLMAPAGEAFAAAVARAGLGRAVPPLVANRSARPVSEPDELAAAIGGQLTRPVRWADSVRWLADAGVDTFVEVGPGEVLTGLNRRILRGEPATAYSVCDPSALDAAPVP